MRKGFEQYLLDGIRLDPLGLVSDRIADKEEKDETPDVGDIMDIKTEIRGGIKHIKRHHCQSRDNRRRPHISAQSYGNDRDQKHQRDVYRTEPLGKKPCKDRYGNQESERNNVMAIGIQKNHFKWLLHTHGNAVCRQCEIVQMPCYEPSFFNCEFYIQTYQKHIKIKAARQPSIRFI